MRPLADQLKADIIEILNLEGLTPADIGDDDPLFNSSLGLDSIDALELIVLLEKKYGCKIASPEEGRSVFGTVNTMVEFIELKNA